MKITINFGDNYNKALLTCLRGVFQLRGFFSFRVKELILVEKPPKKVRLLPLFRRYSGKINVNIPPLEILFRAAMLFLE